MSRLMRDLARKGERAVPGKGVRIYLDLSQLARSGPGELFATMLGALEEKVAGVVSGAAADCLDVGNVHGDFRRLRAALCCCERMGLRVDYLFDGADLLTEHPGFDASFFGALRHLGGYGAVTFACAGRRPLHELIQATPASGSPFWNMFIELNLASRRR